MPPAVLYWAGSSMSLSSKVLRVLQHVCPCSFYLNDPCSAAGAAGACTENDLVLSSVALQPKQVLLGLVLVREHKHRRNLNRWALVSKELKCNALFADNQRLKVVLDLCGLLANSNAKHVGPHVGDAVHEVALLLMVRRAWCQSLFPLIGHEKHSSKCPCVVLLCPCRWGFPSPKPSTSTGAISRQARASFTCLSV